MIHDKLHSCGCYTWINPVLSKGNLELVLSSQSPARSWRVSMGTLVHKHAWGHWRVCDQKGHHSVDEPSNMAFPKLHLLKWKHTNVHTVLMRWRLKIPGEIRGPQFKSWLIHWLKCVSRDLDQIAQLNHYVAWEKMPQKSNKTFIYFFKLHLSMVHWWQRRSVMIAIDK